MFKHNLLLILRNLKKSRGTFFINLVGLSSGLACTLLIYLWVKDEIGMDKFHEKGDRLFQVMGNQKHESGVQTSADTPALLAETLVNEIPEIEFGAVSTPPSWFPNIALKSGEKIFKSAGNFVGPDYFKLFSFPLLQGNPEKVLRDKNAIVISEALALKLFKTTDRVIGKQVHWQFTDLKKTAIISGVFKGTPENSTAQFDFLLSFESFKEIMQMQKKMDSNGPFHTYIVLKEGADKNLVDKKIAGFIKGKFADSNTELFLKPYSDNYLYGTYENGIQNGGRIQYVKLFSLIALFILIMACINFMNLSTARAVRRAKEVGVKKVIGASRKTLVYQYIGESFAITLLSSLLAILIVLIFIPSFNAVTGKELSVALTPGLILAWLVITLLTAALAGSYPAFYLSKFNPVKVLKGRLNVSMGELWVRKGLIVFQFSLSVLFISGVLIIYKQVDYIQNKNLGFSKDNVLYFDLEGKAAENLNTFLAEIKNIPGVVNASSKVGNVLEGQMIPLAIEGPVKKSILFRPMGGGFGLIETLGIQMKEGRPFSPEFGEEDNKIILNEAAVKALDLKKPVVGSKIGFGDGAKEIIGVTKNFHFQSLHEEIKPLFFRYDPFGTTVLVKLKSGAERETIEKLEKFYSKFNPGYTFSYKFLDSEFQKLYEGENRVARLTQWFASLAVIISCLGLFGLTVFSVERRRKEIGIRKVLGSSEWQIIYLLFSEFTKMVFIAMAIGLPISYLVSKDWLDSFAYGIKPEIGFFLLAALLALLLTLVTVGTQTVKAARINPVSSLKED